MKHLKKFKTLAIQSVIFIAMYVLTILVISMSRLPQTAFNIYDVVDTTLSLNDSVFVIALFINALSYLLYYKLNKHSK
jgi:hypothetical protein